MAALPVVAGGRLTATTSRIPLVAWLSSSTLPAVLVAGVALAFRLAHVRYSAKFLVADDAVFFEQHARSFMAAWQAIGTPQFAPALRLAVDDASLQGIVYPLLLSAIYSAAGGVSHGTTGAVQALFGAATVWLTTLTGRRAFGPLAGLTAGLIAAVYPPLVLTSGLLLAEATLALVQAIAVYLLVRGLAPAQWLARLLGGLAIGVLMLRPAFQHSGLLTGIGLLLAWVVGTWLDRRAGARAVEGSRTGAGTVAARRGFADMGRLTVSAGRFLAPYVVGVLLVALPWLTVNGTVFGSWVWSRSGDAWQQVYWGIYPPNRGWWPPDSPVPPKYGVESLPGARASGRVIEVRDLDYLEAAINQVRATPLQAIATEVNKLYQAYLHPYNTYAERPVGLAWLAQPLHRALALFALGGLALGWRRPQATALLAFATLGVSLPFAVSHVDLRYTIPAALMAALFASHAVSELVAWRPPRSVALATLASVAAVFGAWTLGVPVLLSVFPSLPPPTAHRVHTAVVGIAFALAGWIAGDRLGLGKLPAVRRGFMFSGTAVGLTLALLFGIQAFYDGDWHEWSTVLRSGESARQRIVLPAGWSAPPGARAEVRFYAEGSPDHAYEPILSANGQEVARLGPAFTEGGPLRFEERLMVTASQQGKVRAQVPQWYGMPLDVSQLAGGSVTLEVGLRALETGGGASGSGSGGANGSSSGSWIRLWGDYPPLASQRVYEGPSIHSRIQGQDDSFHKLVTTGHTRLWRRAPLSSTAAEPALVSAGAERKDDLSVSPGRQTGEYRLHILVIGPSGDLLAIF